MDQAGHPPPGLGEFSLRRLRLRVVRGGLPRGVHRGPPGIPPRRSRPHRQDGSLPSPGPPTVEPAGARTSGTRRPARVQLSPSGPCPLVTPAAGLAWRPAHREPTQGQTPQDSALTLPNCTHTLTPPKVSNAAPQLSRRRPRPSGARPTTGTIEVADRRFRPRQTPPPWRGGIAHVGHARQRPGVQMITSEEMSSPTVPAPAP